jgi:hypothetical protein
MNIVKTGSASGGNTHKVLLLQRMTTKSLERVEKCSDHHKQERIDCTVYLSKNFNAFVATLFYETIFDISIYLNNVYLNL